MCFDAQEFRPTLLHQVLAEQLPCQRVQQRDMGGIPLHLNAAADPAWRRSVVSGFHFDAAIRVHCAFAVLVLAEWLDWQRKQCETLFGKPRRNLPLSGSVNARVGPALLPVVQIGLRLFEALEALPFERRLLRMPDAGFNLAFAIRVPHAARKRGDAVMLQHIAV